MTSGTRERIVKAALSLFQQSGFAHVGLDQILSHAGLTKTTFYNHFESKEDLIRATLERRSAASASRFDEGLQRLSGDSPRDRILAIFDLLEEQFRENPGVGCLLLNAVIEYPSRQDPTHVLAMQHRNQRLGHFERLAAEAGISNAKVFATQLYMVVDGAMISWQVGHTNNAAVLARQMAEKLIDAHLN